MRTFSLKIKLLAFSLLISVVSFGVAVYISNRWMVEDFKKDDREKAVLMANGLVNSLKEGMTPKPHDGIARSLTFFRNYPEVEEMRVFDLQGKEVFGEGAGTRESRLDEALRTGKMLQFYKQIDQKNVSTYIIPMKNIRECQACHGKSESMRGAILLSLSQEEMEENIGSQRRRFLWLFGLIAGVIGTMTVVAVDRLLVRRLKPIQSGAEAIEKGDFNHRIPVKADDEIGNLARYVNQMAQRLALLFGELEDKNKQLTEQFAASSRSQKEWQETFDCITDPVAVIDYQHRLIRANKALKEVFKEYFHAQDDMINFLIHGTGPLGPEDGMSKTREIRHEWTGKVFEESLFPYHSLEGELAGSVVILKDVTQKKEDEVRLIMNERLVALGQMASGIAHEINTPLATISACNEGLLSRVEKENIGSLLFRSYLKIIEEEIARCKKITATMLSFVRRSHDEKKETDVNEVLDKTMAMVSLQGRLKEVEICSGLQRKIPRVLWNDGELMQVCLSIVVNALDVMEDQGTLTLETGEEKEEERAWVFIKISDTGSGIPHHLIDKIFDPFFTTKSEKGGTGLGLSIVSKLVKDHGGKIDVTSKEGEGTTFKIILPVETK